MGGRWRWVLGVAAVLGAASLALGAPGGRTTTLLTPGTPQGTWFEGASPDGDRVWFGSLDQLAPGDDDNAADVYERGSDGTITLVSIGALDIDADWVGATDSQVFFQTEESLFNESDGGNDVYSRNTAGQYSLWTSPFGAQGETLAAISEDGVRILFETRVPLDIVNDSGSTPDIYERLNASFRLITPGNGAQASPRGMTPAGHRAWFVTATDFSAPGLPAEGTDGGALDIYERFQDGSLRRISVNTPSALDHANFSGASTDGTRVWWETFAPVLPEDDEATRQTDVYETDAAGTVRRISAGSGEVGAFFQGATPDGSKVWFFTRRQLVPEDTDANDDIYERAADGTLTRVSTGNGAANALFEGASDDGAHVFFMTSEALTAGDTNGTVSDLYERLADGTTRLVTPGTQTQSVEFADATADGARVWFTTPESLVADDTDAEYDIYERTPDGRLVLVSEDTSSEVDTFVAHSDDGSRIWFTTGAPVPGTGDTDAAWDVFERAWDVPAVTAPAVTGTPAAGQALTCAGEVVTGEAVTSVARQWLRNGSDVPGATGATLVPAEADQGATFSCRVTATNQVGSTSAESAGVTVPVPPPPPPPDPLAVVPPPAPVVTPAAAAPPPAAPKTTSRARIAGDPILGTRLTCPATVRNSTSRTHVWKRGSRVVGRSSAYRIVSADLGARLTCGVTATGAGGQVTSTSAARAVPRLCTVPPVRGTTTTAARTALGARGCRSRVVRVTGSGVARGRVLGTSPAAGAKRPNGASITLNVRR